ncbi:MarR family winged helix-turn-helix transcriptional regulator [Nocardioides pinisoli]|uniref:MarR family transcriptional regulator n=1 Tax=Nocardioides pinisoli TaxID=2950279 RepID=A0ABT1L365_9ACTN|nr:MarR family transcriptional regulator [Nocardioides pinisoli]MCP3424453.1 MarR family transcriptional regulator [Nocardioides pinisoli]
MSDTGETAIRPAAQADLRAAQALLDLSRVLMGITLRAVAAAPVALTVPQHRVLLMIATDGPRRVGALAEDLGVNQSNASRIVDRLVGQGLVRRTSDSDDRRASLVELTREGRRVLRAVHEHRLAALLDVVAGVPEGAHGLAPALEQLSAAAAEGGPPGVDERPRVDGAPSSAAGRPPRPRPPRGRRHR